MLAVNVVVDSSNVLLHAFSVQTSLKHKVLFYSVRMLQDVEVRHITKVDIIVLTSSK